MTWTDLPLLALVLASISLIVLEGNANDSVADSATYANIVIWALFAIDRSTPTASRASAIPGVSQSDPEHRSWLATLKHRRVMSDPLR